MHAIDRRLFVCGIAPLVLLPGFSGVVAAEAAGSEKTEFMKTAAASLKHDVDAAAPRPTGKRHHHRHYKRYCIPVPFEDFDFYYTDGELSWEPNEPNAYPSIVVPSGFCTDLTSIPQIFWSVLPKTGPYAWAAIVHDYLYWTQTTSRKAADDILYEAMMDNKVGALKRYAIYAAVRTPAGQSAWDANKTARENGEKRLLKVFPPKGTEVSWSEWKKDPSHFEPA